MRWWWRWWGGLGGLREAINVGVRVGVGVGWGWGLGWGVGVGGSSLRIACATDARLGCVILNHQDVAPPPVERTPSGSCARLGGDIMVRVR